MSLAGGQTIPPSRSDSLHVRLDTITGGDGADWDLDELFSKYTVSDVKTLQRQLRADADAKQEELRLMVGERYRDLLQASTSIISIAKSSNRVIEALQETRDAILAEEPPPLPRRKSVGGKDNTHLQMLQLLSAHLKLLLDAPEHLWRLIERKKYFSAAWLFLLARVVHRALVRDDDQDEESWGNHGIDVLEQFPLVQRQWDVVSQFRLQIIHKTTLALRENVTSAQDTCAMLLTLHFLDSRPLMETLSVLLDQRSRSLHALLSQAPAQPGSVHLTPSDHLTNGHPPETTSLEDDTRRTSLREVRNSSQASLDLISRTVTTARSIFEDDSAGHPSLIGGALRHIQSDSPPPSTIERVLPSELQLTTQTLLAALPSSAHFLLLPPNLRSYKPYVDLTSASSSILQPHFAQKLHEWFCKATKSLQETLERWFADLQSVKDVWSIRSSIRKWIHSASGLVEEEQSHIRLIFDDVCRQRVTGIWRADISNAERLFRERLQSSLSDNSQSLTESSPVHHLFKPPPSPTISHSSISHIPPDASFQKYKYALGQQLIGRTASLDNVLQALESCAKNLQLDLSMVDIGNTGGLAAQLTEAYKPNANALCSGVVSALNSAAENCLEGQDKSMPNLVFITQIADELSSSLSFISAIGCGRDNAEDFRNQTAALRDRILDYWQNDTASRISRQYRKSFYHSMDTTSSGPSSTLIQSLLLLSTSIRQLGICRETNWQQDVARETFRRFVTTLLSEWEDDGWQGLWDLSFLRTVVDLWGGHLEDISRLLKEKSAQVRMKLPSEDSMSNIDTKEHLSRTQLLLDALLPQSPAVSAVGNTDKMATLLPFGGPASETHFQSAVEIVKPTARFGLLLVAGGDEVR